mmetsp:Transcript_116314/g.335990  ORF Transcript_116314/g.335990 Transcript_116314/m.335990 type:complete len:1013 (+) Transcript_116314:649-3687(+)
MIPMSPGGTLPEFEQGKGHGENACRHAAQRGAPGSHQADSTLMGNSFTERPWDWQHTAYPQHMNNPQIAHQNGQQAVQNRQEMPSKDAPPTLQRPPSAAAQPGSGSAQQRYAPLQLSQSVSHGARISGSSFGSQPGIDLGFHSPPPSPASKQPLDERKWPQRKPSPRSNGSPFSPLTGAWKSHVTQHSQKSPRGKISFGSAFAAPSPRKEQHAARPQSASHHHQRPRAPVALGTLPESLKVPPQKSELKQAPQHVSLAASRGDAVGNGYRPSLHQSELKQAPQHSHSAITRKIAAPANGNEFQPSRISPGPKLAPVQDQSLAGRISGLSWGATSSSSRLAPRDQSPPHLSPHLASRMPLGQNGRRIQHDASIPVGPAPQHKGFASATAKPTPQRTLFSKPAISSSPRNNQKLSPRTARGQSGPSSLQVTMPGENTTKRKRGRPPKQQVVVDLTASPPIKRERGRPPNLATETKPVEPPVKRKRGRPPKLTTETKKEEHPVKRKRGRPPKQTMGTKQAEHPVKRERGRPRKQSADLDTRSKRKRGRPRKTKPCQIGSKVLEVASWMTQDGVTPDIMELIRRGQDVAFVPMKKRILNTSDSLVRHRPSVGQRKAPQVEARGASEDTSKRSWGPTVRDVMYDARFLKLDESPYGYLDQLVPPAVTSAMVFRDLHCAPSSDLEAHLVKLPDPPAENPTHSRIGPTYQARVCRRLEDYHDKRGAKYLPEHETLWDPNLAAEAERNGENIQEFLGSGPIPLEEKELRMKLLHTHGYNVVKAAEELHQIRALEGTKVTASAQQRMLVLEQLLVHGGVRSKNFTILAEKMDCTESECMVLYYRWKRNASSYPNLKKRWIEERQDQSKNDYCEVCDDGGELVLCDSCNCAYHLDCLNPPLRHFPRGSWHCPKCVAKGPSQLALASPVSARFSPSPSMRSPTASIMSPNRFGHSGARSAGTGFSSVQENDQLQLRSPSHRSLGEALNGCFPASQSSTPVDEDGSKDDDSAFTNSELDDDENN